MRTLIIMRHAKTEQGDHHLKDFERELLPKGENDAQKMGSYLKKKFAEVNEIIASSAIRTKQTAEIVSEKCGGKVNLLEGLYHADANGLMSHIHKADPGTQTLLVVGHNPAVSNLATYLSHKTIELKPSDIVVFEVENTRWDQQLFITGSKHHSVY
jgi:phosphohistidine phosphatase